MIEKLECEIPLHGSILLYLSLELMHLMIYKIDAQSISGVSLNREELKTRKWSGIGPLLLTVAGRYRNFDDIF